MEEKVSSKELSAWRTPAVHTHVHMCTHVHACVDSVGASVYVHIGHRTMAFIRVGSFSEDEVELDLSLTFSTVAERSAREARHLSKTLTRAAEK